MNKRLWLVPALLQAVAALACAVPSLPGSDGALFKDDFSNSESGWGTGSDSTSAVEYVNGELAVQVFETGWIIWSTANEPTLSNVHIEVTAKNVGGGLGTPFGIICNYQDQNNFYYFAINSAGDYAIAKTVPGSEDIFLTNDNLWDESSDIADSAASYRIGADCANGTLTLYVDGKQIASVADSTYTTGDVGVFAWTEQDDTAQANFDDFIVTAVK
ncbi:MAG: hypothetical protein FJ030_10670 [Chloroflexi bacterium]|nr:hypothetical protein [Chloroflexota bacterium]